MAKTKEGQVTKTSAVKQALQTFGRKVKAIKALPWIKEQFGLEMSPNHFSNIKSTLKGKRKGGQKKQSQPETPAEARPQSPRATPRGVAIAFADIEAVKELAARYGAKNLNQLIDVLGE